jgi:hypothetical protein
VLHEPLDGAALASRVTPFEQHHQLLSGVADPGLRLQELDLQEPLGRLVLVARHPVVVRVALSPRLDREPVRAQEHRIVDLVPGVVGRQAVGDELLRGQVL